MLRNRRHIKRMEGDQTDLSAEGDGDESGVLQRVAAMNQADEGSGVLQRIAAMNKMIWKTSMSYRMLHGGIQELMEY